MKKGFMDGSSFPEREGGGVWHFFRSSC